MILGDIEATDGKLARPSLAERERCAMSETMRKKVRVGIVVSTIGVVAICLIGLAVILSGESISAFVGNNDLTAWVPSIYYLSAVDFYN